MHRRIMDVFRQYLVVGGIQPIEVKSTGEYETKSLTKFIAKYGKYLGDPCVLYTKDLKRTGDRLYLPVYMAGFVGERSSLVTAK